MTKYEAHIILNQVREGVIYPQSVVLKALVTTGDINVRCVSVDSRTVIRSATGSYPHSLHPLLPLLEG